jgi:hypothetical protein
VFGIPPPETEEEDCQSGEGQSPPCLWCEFQDDRILARLPWLLLTGVAVEKVQFPPKQPKFGGYKMPRKLRKSFVELPNAILFLRISRERVFQQPQAITLRMPGSLTLPSAEGDRERNAACLRPSLAVHPGRCGPPEPGHPTPGRSTVYLYSYFALISLRRWVRRRSSSHNWSGSLIRSAICLAS